MSEIGISVMDLNVRWWGEKNPGKLIRGGEGGAALRLSTGNLHTGGSAEYRWMFVAEC